MKTNKLFRVSWLRRLSFSVVWTVFPIAVWWISLSCTDRSVKESPTATTTPSNHSSASDAQTYSHIPQYVRADSIKVESLLAQARRLPDKTNWMIHFGLQFLDIPYVAHTLENNPKERSLKVNLRELDCTTFVENVVALTMCMKQHAYTFKAFTHCLETIRYNKHDGLTEYPQRLHYFTSWVEDNERAGIVKELQSPNPPFTAVQKLDVYYMTKHSDQYSMLRGQKKWIEQIKQVEKKLTGKEYRYIPIAQLRDSKHLRATVKDGDIIVIITNADGLDSKHIALAQWKKDGLHIMHASSVKKKVIEDPRTLQQYLQGRKNVPGVRVLRVI